MRTNLYNIAIILLIFLLPFNARADLKYLYSDSELENSKILYLPGIKWNWDNLLPEYLTKTELSSLGDVKIELVTPSSNNLSSGNLFLSSKCQPPTVYLPVFLLKFIDDLSITYAYLLDQEKLPSNLFEYLIKLKYSDSSLRHGNKFIGPLDYFKVPNKIWEQNKKVDDIAQKILKSASVWLLAQELGHIYYRDCESYKYKSIEEKEIAEIKADRFATELMRRIGALPIGTVFYFTIRTYFEPVLLDFESDKHYDSYILKQSVNPITPNRLRQFSSQVSEGSYDFARTLPDQHDPEEILFSSITNPINNIFDYLSNIDLQIRMKEEAIGIKSSGRACDGQEREIALKIIHESIEIGYQAGLTGNFNRLLKKLPEITRRTQALSPPCQAFIEQTGKDLANRYRPSSNYCYGNVCCDGSGCFSE